MPGSVASASIPVVSGNPIVLPFFLCKAFMESRSWEMRVNEYHDGTTERMALVSTARRSWQLAARLAPSVLNALWAFWSSWPTAPFYFYDVKEPASGQPVGSNYDPSGASIQGRYMVRFAGDWAETIFIPRAEVAIQLVEVA